MAACVDETAVEDREKQNDASTKETGCCLNKSPGDGKVQPGIARIKPEFVKQSPTRHVDAAFVAPSDRAADDGNGTPPPRKKLRGQNHSRPHHRPQPQSVKLCFRHLAGDCLHGQQCRYSHDLQAFLDAKPSDLGEKCPLVDAHGGCRYGVACRFAQAHPGGATAPPHHISGVNGTPGECNALDKELQQALRKRQFDFGPAEKILKEIATGAATANGLTNGQQAEEGAEHAGLDEPKKVDFRGKLYLAPLTTERKGTVPVTLTSSSVSLDSAPSRLSRGIPWRAFKCGIADGRNIRQEHFSRNMTDLIHKSCAQVSRTRFRFETEVGNLPFRRVCKEFGADVTCGEMAMAANLLQGQPSEWALVKRHSSEDLFGVQLCGAHPDVMTRCAQLLRDKCRVDFVDINMGCPIDFVYKKGAGSGLMGRAKKLAEIVYGMVGVLDVPVTVKMRAGMQEGRQIAHQVIGQLVGAPRKPALITVHPRSREQRYTKSADWAYLERCAQAAAPIPVFGSGDILTWEDAEMRLSETSVSGLMIARGALIKPWIFTEIKERRHWDISSSERLDILRKYVAYGLDHWGSDTEGVERTRRFLLEWLSFLHRYIPVGLLEVLPQKINERPPPYYGRDDLETLFASPSCADWLKISEMLLGPLPEGFSFLPKHKANAYSV